jgi:ribA/ribD-fused uncharacterized protein
MSNSSSTSSQVGFYDCKEQPYGVFSNYHLANIIINGISFKSSEEFYQCEKFEDEWYREQIKATNTSNKSRVLGHQEIKYDHQWQLPLNAIVEESFKRGVKPKANFDQIKDKVMLTALWAKFTQHLNLQQLLLSTGEAYIYENSPYDSYWGTANDK